MNQLNGYATPNVKLTQWFGISLVPKSKFHLFHEHGTEVSKRRCLHRRQQPRSLTNVSWVSASTDVTHVTLLIKYIYASGDPRYICQRP